MFQVVGVPVTINGDLKNQFVEANVGFDTTCKVNLALFFFYFVGFVANIHSFPSSVFSG